MNLPRYVILEHTGTASYKPGRHWDLMLQAGECLRTWELDRIPTAVSLAQAVSLPDHRPDYLDYQGPIAGDRGTVWRWDWGDYQTVRETPLEIDIHLDGQRLQGRLRLVRESADVAPWRATFEPQ
jgi:hypothetical protein